MQKHLLLLLNLLEIPATQEYKEIARKIEESPEQKLNMVHKYSFIFEWYQDLINDKITAEEFLSIWDFQSKQYPASLKNSLEIKAQEDFELE